MFVSSSDRKSAVRANARSRRTRGRLLAEPLEPRYALSGIGSISGAVWEDAAADGIDAGDSRLANWAVFLYRDNGDGALGAGDPLVAQEQTLPNGQYQFSNLSAGTYFVQQQLPLGWVQTAPSAHEHDDPVVTPAQAGPIPKEKNDTLALAIATGLNSSTPSTYVASGVIGDNEKVKELDVDLFRLFLNAGDQVHVDIDAVAFGSPLDSIVRLFDAAGNHLVGNDDLPGASADPGLTYVAKTSGTYYVGVSGFANAAYSALVEGSGTLALNTGPYTIQIDVGPREGAEPVAVAIDDDSSVTGVDLAATHLGTIRGQMFEDIDGDGVQDPGELGQNGQFVLLQFDGVYLDFQQTRSIDLDGNGIIDPATEAGWYVFENLAPGLYFTRGLASFNLAPAGWIQTVPSMDQTEHDVIGHVEDGPSVVPAPLPGLLPDLTVHLETGLGNWFISEGVLHFGQATPNIGLGPMELRAGQDLGDGTQVVQQRIYQDAAETTFIDRDAGFFTFHPQHNHIHFDEYAVFTLRAALPDADGDGVPEVGDPVTEGQKRSFCLIDVAPYDLSLPNADADGSGLGCDTVQRISVGWEDIYDPFTAGQQIDISDLPEGQYWLEAVVDPFDRLVESNENNNVGRVLITNDALAPGAPRGMQAVSIVSGQTVSDADFGNFHTISVSGQVYYDRNADGIQDPKDNGLAGFVVFLDLNGDGILNNAVEGDNVPSPLAAEPWAITDKHGDFAFSGVGPGTFAVRQLTPTGWLQTTPNPPSLSATSGQNVSAVRFGNAADALTAQDEALLALLAEELDPLSIWKRRRW